MSLTREQVYEIVVNAVRNLASANPENESVEYNGDVRLLGSRSVLDSIGFVTMLIDIEQTLSEEFEIYVTIADEKAMSQQNSPFRTIQTLTDYVFGLITSYNQ